MTTYSDPGYIASLSDHVDRYESSTVNALRDRVVHHFATSADRDAAITSPTAGMACFLLSTGELLIWSGATDTWQPPWNTAWGEVAHAEMTASQTGITTVTDLLISVGVTLQVTWTAVANRLYQGTLYIPRLTQNTSQGDVTAEITDSSNNVSGQVVQTLPAAAKGTLEVVRRFTGLSAGSTVRKARLTSSAGTVDVPFVANAQVAFLSIMDIGPNGAPS